MIENDIVVAGHICLDITPKFDSGTAPDIGELIRPGKLLKIGDAIIGTGGSVSNTGIALSKLGLPVSYMSSVGMDSFGDIIIDRMSEYGNVEGFHRNKEVGSSYSVILAIPPFDRIILHNPGCNDYFKSFHIDWDIVSSARLFHLGYPPIMRTMYSEEGRELVELLRHVKSLGLATSIDMALPDPKSEAGMMDWQPWMSNVLPYVDFFMPSIEELLLFTNRQKWQEFQSGSTDYVDLVPVDLYRELSDDLLAFGCPVIILKAGHRGIYMRTGSFEQVGRIKLFQKEDLDNWCNRELWGPGYRIEKIQSATGAGDSAVAGILAAVLDGTTCEEALRMGNCLGYQNLLALDTTSGIGSYEESRSLLTRLQPISTDFLDDSWALGDAGVFEKIAV